jgi:hypothetical protein
MNESPQWGNVPLAVNVVDWASGMAGMERKVDWQLSRKQVDIADILDSERPE